MGEEATQAQEKKDGKIRRLEFPQFHHPYQSSSSAYAVAKEAEQGRRKNDGDEVKLKKYSTRHEADDERGNAKRA